MTGIKLTVFLPLLNAQIRVAAIQSVSEGEAEELYTVVCCHSFARCEEVSEFCKELVHFCPEMLEVVCLDSADQSDAKARLNQVQSKSRLVVSTPTTIQALMNSGFFDSPRKMVNLVVDKVDLAVAMDFQDELLDIATLAQSYPLQKVILTTTVLDESEQAEEDREAFKAIKAKFSGDKKSFLIKVKEEERQVSAFERTQHLYGVVSSSLDKFLVLFNFLKLAIIEGKCAIFVNEMVQAYRLKYFLSKFSLRAFVLSPDMPKNQISSIMHFFHIGQFDIIIMMHTGYSKRPVLKEVATIFNFDAPSNYNLYKENAQLINEDNGTCLTLYLNEEAEMEKLELMQRKCQKNFGRSEMMQCLPLLWSELARPKSRVQQVISMLSNKSVLQEKVLEFKKQLVSNKSLKEYFKNNPQEKEILMNDIVKAHSKHDKYLFRNLDVLPSYIIPEAMVAVTAEQLETCTLGCESIKHLSSAFTSGPFGARAMHLANLDSPSPVLQNLVGFPAAVNRYKSQTTTEFPTEDPTLKDYNALEPTSGRKIWKLKHGKRIRKAIKADKTGFIGQNN